MKPITEVVKELLCDGGYAEFNGTGAPLPALVVDELQESPSAMIAVKDAGGAQPAFSMDHSANPLEYCAFTLQVRGTAYNATYNRAYQLARFLEQVNPFTDAGATSSDEDVRYWRFLRTANIIFVKRDDKDRCVFNVYMRATREVQ